jgi:hypothetical protein
VAAHQEKEVMEVTEDAARQAVALLQGQSIHIATVESTAGPFLGLYHAAIDIVALADDAAMAEAYVVGMVVPQEQPDKEDDASDHIEALFGDSSNSDVVVPAMMDEQVALLTSFETMHHEEGTRQFMAAEREALAAMIVVRANATREVARVAAQEEVARVAACVAEAAARSWRSRRRRLARRRGQRSSPRRWRQMRQHMRRWPGTATAGTRTWPRRGVLARSMSSPARATTAATWLASRPSVPARPTMRARTPSTPVGATTCCKRLQAKDGGAATVSRGRVV